MSDDLARLAAGLTKAQRRAVMTLSAPDGGGMWPARNALIGKGLMSFPRYQFTDLAVSLRRYLKEQADEQ